MGSQRVTPKRSHQNEKMHVRVRFFGYPDAILVVESKLTKIEQFRRVIEETFKVEPKLQRLIYGGKLLEDGYTFHDYNIKLNDVIQLMERVQPLDKTDNVESKSQEDETASQQVEKKNIQYKDAISSMYKVGDFIDTKQKEGGYWLEGSITRIVFDPEVLKDNIFSENDPEIISDENILLKVRLDQDTEEEIFCKPTEVRPRARNEINLESIQIGQTVMINYNIDDPGEIGNWYDFKVDEIKKHRKTYELTGTIYLGPESVPQNNTSTVVKDKVFAIEEPVPLSRRTEEYNQSIAVPPPKRRQPIHCKKCGDDESRPCRRCGCYVCASKDSPGEIILCDECDNGFHLKCLKPALEAIPVEDWYCDSCRRDPNDVVAPGAARQAKKTTGSETTRDWGRGMACVGKTKDSDMPADHFGPIPGMEVGMIWRYRMQLSETGLHRPSVSGIHGRDAIGAFSIVLSGGYEDDVDHGVEFTYTGSGGRDLSGNKRTAEQSCDQKFTRENRALARNCAAKSVNENGGDAGDNWRQGKPVRVMRSYKMRKAFPKYAPLEGIRYDGIYKVVKYYPEKGLSGFRVYKYLLRRDDPSPAPWEPGAKQFTIVYPDGYLEAEAQKLKLKQQKNKPKDMKNVPSSSTKPALLESNHQPICKGKKSINGSKSKQTSKKTNGASKTSGKRRKISSSEDDTDSSEGSEDSIKISKKSPKKETIDSNEKSVKKIDVLLDNSLDKSDGNSDSCKKKVKLGFAVSQAADESLQQSVSGVKKTRKRKNSPGDNRTQTKLTFSPVTKKPKISFNEDSNSNSDKENALTKLTASELKAIRADEQNAKLWAECLEICDQHTKKELIEHVMQVFRCIICQGLAVSPVTTPCLHNFCLSCMKRAFKVMDSKSCPYCRQKLSGFEPTSNAQLRTALRTILPGYDAGQK
ncbi:E3 ubiquitin-protein ligase UHRF1-like [Maniola jurtina]|uniref:E3 ubiquitin-protein ligase UHRF1-like n=1 Tax=Maniola jurtina TaxID=191418 RepID=UPI001E68EF15|nr:E3 ubiquitin-protein ligase UHRF1-like [Maniola jurtina]